MESTETGTSATLLGQLREHPDDGAAWARFVARYGPQIQSWCHRWGLQDADACDVMQIVLVKLFRTLRTFEYDPKQSFRGWLRTLAHHAWRDFAESRDRPGRGSGDDAMTEILHSVEAREDLFVRLDTVFDRELVEEARARVQRLVKPRTWEAYRLLAGELLSGREVAEMLGMTVPATYQAKHRVQNLLKEELERLSRPDGEARADHDNLSQ